MSQKTVTALVVITAIGMVGIYVGAYIAYQKYEANKSTVDDVGGVVNLLGSLLGSSTSK